MTDAFNYHFVYQMSHLFGSLFWDPYLFCLLLWGTELYCFNIPVYFLSLSLSLSLSLFYFFFFSLCQVHVVLVIIALSAISGQKLVYLAMTVIVSNILFTAISSIVQGISFI